MRLVRNFPSRLGGSRSHLRASEALCCGQRCIHRHHSPDRSYSEEIQDRQNAFQWSAHHLFRPHQHFTYDPTSWSRALERKSKKTRTLSLVERIKLSQDHMAESAGNVTALEKGKEGHTWEAYEPAALALEMDVPDRSFASADASTSLHAAAVSVNPSPLSKGVSAVSLQELVEEVQRLQSLLHCPRYSGNASLRRRARQEADLRATLLHLYQRLRDARLDETVTPDAAAYSWFLLTRNLEPLLEVVTSTRQQEGRNASSEGGDEIVAIRDVSIALSTTVLRPMVDGGRLFNAATSGELSLEALIELLSIATTPFVRRCAESFPEDGVVASKTLLHYAECISTAARQRAHEVAADCDGAAHAALQEWLDPTHLAAWAISLKRLQVPEAPFFSAVAGLELQVEHAAEYVTQLLEAVTGVTPRGHVTASLSRLRPGPQGSTSLAQRGNAPKPVGLDATAAPHGVQTPPTESGDTGNILVAATATLHLAHRAAGIGMPREESVRRIVDVCLRMLAHTPNYDICPDEAVAWACEVLDGGYLTQTSGLYHPARSGSQATGESGTAGLRFLLLLSRLSYDSVAQRAALGRLVVCLCRWPEPVHTTGKEASEWRRLRGVVMRGALHVLQVPDLEAGAAPRGSEEAASYLEALAFGEYGGVIPMALWRDAALSLFPRLRCHVEDSAAAAFPPLLREHSSAIRCRPEDAQALCFLCSRYVAREKTGASTPTNLYSIFTVRCVAACLAVLLNDPALPEALLRSADAWDGLSSSLPEPVQVVATCMQEVVRRQVAPSKVLSF
ncbi:hypothetical protein LSCM4_05543 [Leishmania orientalis]|uniref:Uncharacterized protein n=1 Tax=Leishmania orientalis TaxID=2249476 RepID=A0A836HSU3_9TRYP|nr:hypothetical protein LSCM4_05543 [Leishmania orientalis]